MTYVLRPMQLLFNLKQGVASIPTRMYRPAAVANSAVRFGDLNFKLAHKRPMTIAGAFFVLAMLLYGGRTWETFGSAGCQLARFANLRTAATHNRLATVRGSSTSQVGATHMQYALNPSRLRAAAHRAMAIAALHADSSLATRLKRYNAAMAKARALEAQGGAQ
ncbi:hypothetical protein BGP82_23230 [Pseudomonas putida]|uniref:Uncharacterized protein n=1 Tax=Pseudomonas putida TaxID=303 RepID=A0A2S3WS17_PSEPU|nr:hypothetical protein [Pseudomonas putida]POG04169.1 hypothetical protein BGP82_23230 [Pseudomonas putida]